MDKFTLLAKQAVETYVRSKRILAVPADLPAELYTRRAGVFVTLHKENRLRGCIGTYRATKKNLAEEIVANAISACTQDRRFYPVEEGDLSRLQYEVSVLNEPEALSSGHQHNPKKQGILVTCPDGRGGLLLPDLEGVDSLEQQLAIACQKGGIDPQDKKMQLFSFTVEKHN